MATDTGATIVGANRRRQEALAALQGETWDLLVIGGGITGAGIALDAAARGMRVALVERADFASGTSSASTKLIHGGVRYLAQLDFSLVREGLHERHVLGQIAPHLVRPLPFLLPVYRGVRPLGLPFRPPVGSRTLMDLGLTLYDLLGGRRTLQRHRRLSGRVALQEVPALRAEGLQGAFIYFDGQTDDTRLVLAVLAAALTRGAVALNYAEATGFGFTEGRIDSAMVRDQAGREELRVCAARVVNATGAWSGAVRALATEDRLNLPPAPALRPSKGVHILIPPSRLPLHGNAVVIPETEDGRISFAVPWGQAIVLGTTDTPYSGDPRELRVTLDEVDLLLRDANRFFTTRLSRDDVISVYAGLRPLVDSGAASTARQSRTHKIDVGPGGLVSITGGKLTTYRRMAAETVDRALRERPGHFPASSTEQVPVAGVSELDDARRSVPATVRALDLPDATGVHLLATYGAGARDVLTLVETDATLGQIVAPGLPYIAAEVVYGVRHDAALTIGDVLRRRTRIVLEDRTQGRAVAPRVAELMAAELGWSTEQRAQALADYEHEAARHALPGR